MIPVGVAQYHQLDILVGGDDLLDLAERQSAVSGPVPGVVDHVVVAGHSHHTAQGGSSVGNANEYLLAEHACRYEQTNEDCTLSHRHNHISLLSPQVNLTPETHRLPIYKGDWQTPKIDYEVGIFSLFFLLIAVIASVSGYCQGAV